MDALHGATWTVRQPTTAASGAERAEVPATRYQPLIVVVVAAATGIGLDRYGSAVLKNGSFVSLPWPIVWSLTSAAFVFIWFLFWRTHFNKSAAWMVFLAVAFGGAAWHHWQWNVFGQHDASRFATLELTPTCIEAIALAAPERVSAPRPTPLRAIPGGEQSRLRLDIVRIRDGKRWLPASGTCELLVNGHLLAVGRGDHLRVFGQFSRINPPLNPGEFDFAAHAHADRELVRVRSSVPESVTVISSASRWRMDRIIGSVRARAKQLIRRYVGPERADLACAILLGSREGLTAEETEPYLLTGTIHVLVVSGMNVGILALGLYFLMQAGWLSRRLGLAIIMAVVIAYALVAEGQPPVARAAIFAVLICIGAWIGRRGVAFNSLAAAALFVLAFNPAELFRAGPQLSFLAVAALIWTESWWKARNSGRSDPLDQLIEASRPWPRRVMTTFARAAGWLLLTSLVVWAITLPLLLNQFHIASPVSVVISPVLWIVVWCAMWSGFLLLALGWLLPPIGAACGAVCATSLGMLERLVDWAEQLPGGHFFSPGPAWWWVLVFYIAVLILMVRGTALVPLRWQLAMLCAWTVVGVVPPLVRSYQRDSLECSFVSVGHGACVLLETSAGETLLYDAGSLGSPEFATQTIASYLWHRGINRLDGIVVSHADIDHYNAVPGLLERFNVGAIYVSPMMFDGFDDSQAGGPQVLLDAIRDAGVPLREVWAGDRLRLGDDVSVQVFHPPKQGVLGSDNANSITLTVEHRGHRVLLPGDLETPGIEDVMAELPYDCEVLLAPHHGSRRSDPPGFAAWSTPNWVVISGGGSNDLTPVVQTYQRAGANVLHTNKLGMIRFSLDDGPLEMVSWRPPAGD